MIDIARLKFYLVDPQMKNLSDQQPISSGSLTADRVLIVLDLLAASEVPLSAQEIAEKVPCSRNAAYRSLSSLVNAGYVVTDTRRGKFKLSLRSVRLGRHLIERAPILSLVQEVIEKVANETGESCNYEELQGTEVVVLARADGRLKNPHRFEIGQSTPAASTSIGRAILSQRHRRDAAKLLEAGLKPWTEFTQTDSFKYLEGLDKIRDNGFAIDDQELLIGLRCVAVPIVIPNQQVKCGMAICGPLERFTYPYMKHLAETLKKESRYLATSLEKILVSNGTGF